MIKSVLFLLLVLSVSQVQSAEFQLKPSEKKDTVFFESDAKLEFIAGKTTDIEGNFSFNIESPHDSLYGILKVDLRTLKTQIATRDKHMREDYLETDKYPFAYFELLSVENLPKIIHPDSTYSVVGNGYFFMHGVKNKLKPEISMRVLSKDGIRQVDITVQFHLLLEDYDIERPQLVLLKVAKQINISLKFSAFQTETFQRVIIPQIYK